MTPTPTVSLAIVFDTVSTLICAPAIHILIIHQLYVAVFMWGRRVGMHYNVRVELEHSV